MSETVITSVAEFHEQLRQRATGAAVFLYRGQAEAAWPVSCSAARRLTKDPADPLEIQNVSFRTLIGYLEFLIARAKMRGFLPPGIDMTSPDLELLAQLQHQGAATGLIDFTRDHLAGYKLPKQVLFVDEVRRAPNGKADYKWARTAAERAFG